MKVGFTTSALANFFMSCTLQHYKGTESDANLQRAERLSLCKDTSLYKPMFYSGSKVIRSLLIATLASKINFFA